MKTIITFLLGILFLTIATFFMIEAVTAVHNANQLYTGTTINDLYDFKVTFLFTALALAILSIVSIGHAVFVFKIFYDNYCNIMKRKRDNHIKSQLIEAKYDKLYNDLNNTNIYEEKQKLIHTFYNPAIGNRLKYSIKEIMEDMKAERKRTAHDEDIFNTSTN